MRKPDKLKFKRLAMALLDRLGAKPGGMYGLNLNTSAGRLLVCVYDGAENRKFSPWIASRFEDPDAAKIALGNQVNPWTGKWNHHFPASWTPEQCVESFEHQLTALL